MKITQKRISRIVILLIALILIHTFVSCGGLAASQIEEKETKSKIAYIERPEHETLETLAPYVNPTLPSDEDETQKPTNTVRYAASRESNKYHRTYCHYVDNILPENLVYYTSEEAARRAGKTPCSACKP